jgi:hypothetical protein
MKNDEFWVSFVVTVAFFGAGIYAAIDLFLLR